MTYSQPLPVEDPRPTLAPEKGETKKDRDIYMPESLKTIPVVALTSSRETPDLVEFYKHGVNAYVVKPVDFSEFMKSVKRLGIFWAAVNEPPPYIAKGAASIQNGEFISPEKKEVKNEIPAPHPVLGG